MKHQPLVSIILINWNQLPVTLECLESLSRLTYTNYEIILVDNASKEDPSKIVKEKFPHVRMIRTDQNLGFTGGNNIGLKIAKGDYFFILNNDTEVASTNLLEKLIEPFEKDPSIGMVSPKIRYFSHPDVIQYAGYTKINPFTGKNRQVGEKEEDKGQHNVSGYTDYANGAAMLVKREVADRVGVFPDHFFIYYEELDWSSQTVKHGYKIYYQSEVFIYHKESITMGKASAIKTYYNNKNRILFMRRNSNGFQLMCFLGFLVAFTIPKNTLSFLFTGKFEHLRSFYRGVFWNVKNMNLYKHEPLNKSLATVEPPKQVL
jgi:GT2 family glycosyltransferase